MCRFMSKHGSDHYVLFCHDPLSRLDIMQLSLASPWADPLGTPGEPRVTQGGVVQFGIYFSLAEEGSCLVWTRLRWTTGIYPAGISIYPRDLFVVVCQASALPGAKVDV